MYNIPHHTNCKNCGECCYFILVDSHEEQQIKDFVKRHKVKPFNYTDGRCKYHDNKANKCLIYPVRPVICRLMGVTKGMTCLNGNTCEIDGSKFIVPSMKRRYI